jgi:nucleoside permease NupC
LFLEHAATISLVSASRAMLAGTMANLMSASIVSMLIR